MAEEIVKVIVQQENQGTALKDAQRDAEKLQQTNAKPAAQPTAATTPQAKAPASASSNPSAAATPPPAKAPASAPSNSSAAATPPPAKAPASGKAPHRQTFGSARMVGDALDMVTGTQGWVMRAQMVQNLPHLLKGLGFAGVAAGAAGLAFGVANAFIHDHEERKGIALRDAAARKLDERGLGIMAGVRGTSGNAQSEQDAVEQRMAEREANRPDLAWKGRRAWYNPLRWFGRSQTWESQRELAENDAGQKRDAEHLEELKRLKHEKFENEEGGLGLDALRQRSKRTQSGQREAFMDDYLAKALQVKRQMRAQGATTEEQNEAAQLDMTNSLRDRQVKAGASLVDARSGAGDIAAAAAWGRQVNPNEAEMLGRFDKIISRMDAQSDEQRRIKQDVK